MPSRNHRGNPTVIVGYKIYYHDGSGETFVDGEVVRPLVNLKIVTVPPSISFVDWVGRWAVAQDDYAQIVAPFTDMQYEKTLTETDIVTRRVHELLFNADYYYLDVSQGATLAAFKTAGSFSEIPAPLRTLSKRGFVLDRSLWHAVYDFAYDDWSI